MLRGIGLGVLAAATLGAPAVAQTAAMRSAMPAATAEYTIVFKSTWTAANHPFEYPAAGLVSGPHFSGLIGATHDASYMLFAEGKTPTRGLENLSEQGKHSPLDAEIRRATGMGGVGTLFESGPLRDFGDSIVVTVRVDDAHPLVSLVAMIAPSPDWFTGAANVDLMENGAWVGSRTLQLYAYDSGGDDGATYKAQDMDAQPKHPTMRATTPHFVVNGQAVPVASVTFRKH